MMAPRRRVILWLGGLVVYTLLLVYVGTFLLTFLVVSPPWGRQTTRNWVDHGFKALGEGEWWSWALPGSAIIAASQFLFLLPVVRLRPPQGERSRPLAVSLVLGGLVAALLTLGLAVGLAELVAGLAHGDLSTNPWGDSDLLDRAWVWPGAAVTMLGSWLLWSGLLFVFTRKLWADKVVGRLSTLLLGGTVAELLVVVPIDVMVRRRTSCVCGTGTFWSLCFSAVAILWLTGPGIMLALTSKRRRLVRVTHCAACGQAKGPTPGPACPECGYAWLEPSGIRTTAGGVADYTDARKSGTDGGRSSAG